MEMKTHIILLWAAAMTAALMISGCSSSKETEKEMKPQAEKAASPEQAMPQEGGTGQETSQEASQSLKAGEQLFKLHCTICHRDGGNIINPQKPLHKERREASGVKTAEDIIQLMRNPGPGMSRFDEVTISNADAKHIAEYILNTF